MTDNELKEDVKNKLRMYNPYTKKIFQLQLEIESIHARIFEDSAGSFPKIPDGNTVPDIHRKSPLWDEIRELEKEISNYSLAIDQVNNFIRRLNAKEKDIIKKLYLDKSATTFTDLCGEYNYSRTGLQYIVDNVIKMKWEY